MLKALLIVFGLITFWVFLRNFFWPWLSNQIFFWKYARSLRRIAKDINSKNNPALKEVAEMIEELANKTDERRRESKL